MGAVQQVYFEMRTFVASGTGKWPRASEVTTFVDLGLKIWAAFGGEEGLIVVLQD